MALSESFNSIVKLEQLYFKKIEFHRSAEKIPNEDLLIRFTRTYNFNGEHTECNVNLGCHITDSEQGKIKIDIIICGVFTCTDENLERRNTLLTQNTLAILFPYLRSEVSLVTAQPDMIPIVLPPINIKAVFENNSEE